MRVENDQNVPLANPDFFNNPAIPPIPPPIPNVKNKNRPVLLYIIITLLILAVVFLGYEVYTLKKSVPTAADISNQTQVSPAPTISVNPTADWKTYTNTKYDFSFNYPDTYFKYQSDMGNGVELNHYSKSEISTMNLPPGTLPKGTVWIETTVFSGINGTLDNYLINDSLNNQSTNFFQSGDKSKISIAGLDAYEIDHLTPYGPTQEVSYTTIALSENKIYSFSLHSFEPETLTGYKTTFDQILSTFRFTNVNNNQDSAETVVKKYLDASVKGDLETAKIYCPDIQSTALNGYNFVNYEITGSKADNNPNYYHVYVKFTDKSGKIWDKAPNTQGPLEVYLNKDSNGAWKALTWYFYQ
jgi:hypothetical protein